MLQFYTYIQVANRAPRPVVTKGMEAVEAEVTAHISGASIS